MNFDLKIGKAVQLLLLGVVCLGGYALIADTHYQSTKGAREVREALRAGDRQMEAIREAQSIQADLCASFKDLGIRDENCP